MDRTKYMITTRILSKHLSPDFRHRAAISLSLFSVLLSCQQEALSLVSSIYHYAALANFKSPCSGHTPFLTA
jgi:hypothetical protein